MIVSGELHDGVQNERCGRAVDSKGGVGWGVRLPKPAHGRYLLAFPWKPRCCRAETKLLQSTFSAFAHTKPRACNGLEMMRRYVRILLITIGTYQALPGETRGQDVDFNRHIRPLLSRYCFQCHGPSAEDREADLRLDVEEDAKTDRGGYAVIAAGNAEHSELILRLTSADPDLRMPPPETGKQLGEAEIQLLRRWIQRGAPWSEQWAYVPPTRHAVPVSPHGKLATNWIDQFVLARVARAGLPVSPVADRITLIRRLYFDLVGLPPTTAEVDSFIREPSEDAYERLVDHLLQSPHFGERMAMYWLDLVRYADTVGYHGDQDHNISPYRDYVIDALNRNLPFDQFTREQLAGDLLSNPTVDQRVATGYNRLLQTSHEGGVQPKEYLAIYAADRVRNLSAVWLGGTFGCAQCHDHKYDPYTSKDFYAMAAFFADIDEEAHFKKGSNSLPTARPSRD